MVLYFTWVKGSGAMDVEEGSRAGLASPALTVLNSGSHDSPPLLVCFLSLFIYVALFRSYLSNYHNSPQSSAQDLW
jgi:hypothetical protein